MSRSIARGRHPGPRQTDYIAVLSLIPEKSLQLQVRHRVTIKAHYNRDEVFEMSTRQILLLALQGIAASTTCSPWCHLGATRFTREAGAGSPPD
jgi:hypothetical protein